jgi:predicted ATPase
VVDRHYVGLDVHRAARIGACGHGGQVVLSPTTVALLEPDEFVLRDLGSHRLKDLAAPVVLAQLGGVAHPPLKALFRTNLPIPATPFLGREDELSELVTLATQPGVRLLTLTGPGGTGKTRLSLQLAAELSESYPDGIWWVPLAPLRDGALVASAVANALDIDEAPGREITESIAEALARKRLLLLLDNCEHLVESAARLVSSLVAACPEVFVVATSREPLAISGENVVAVEPLVADDAVELFHARARAAGARLDPAETSAVVTELCARLDNLPLAVELAAARAAVLPPTALLERLATRIDVLSGPRDSEERQRTLRAAIAWSYDLLEERERQLFRRLAVFVGGASLSAIEDVCEADLAEILSLVSKSLVRQVSTDSDEPRYFMLETIREFAATELATAGELEVARDRHVSWFADIARTTGIELDRADSGERLARLELDLANLRAAFAWTEQRPATAQDGVALTVALENRHFLRGRYSEAEGVIRRALLLELEPLDAAVLHGRLGSSLRLQGRPREALDSFRQAERALETIRDRNDEWWECWLDVEIRLATFFYFRNEQEALAELAGGLEPLVREHGTARQRLDFLHLRNQRAYREERYTLSEETEERVRETYRIAVELGEPGTDFTLGFCLLWRGKPAEAEGYFARGRDAARSDGFALVETRCLVYGVIARRRQNDVEGARAWLGDLLAQDELHGYVGLTRACQAWVAYRDGDLELAARCGEEALADWASEGRVGAGVFQWTALFPLLGVAVARGKLDDAVVHAAAILDPSQQSPPSEIASVLRRAVDEGGVEYLSMVLELARSGGYA